MSPHLERARLLLQQSRPAEAEREAMQSLAARPDDPYALSLLALSRIDQCKNAEALQAAEAAVGLAPDGGYQHYIHALVLHRLDREKDSREAIAEAIRINPGDASYFSLLSSIEYARRNWPAALEAAEQALALSPEHVRAANLRAMALVQLGRKEEAMQTVDYALRRAPEDALSHANQGWNCLHRNDPRQAQEHFREALRLDPSLDYARQGMLEALKARNPVYRAMLAYFLWIGRLSRKLQWLFIIVVYFTVRFAFGLASTQPRLRWVLWPLLVLFYAFIYLSWTSMPMFNLLLRLDRFGRHVLSREQRIASNWFALPLGLALLSLAWWALGGREEAVICAAVFALLSVCVAATFNRRGRSRHILMAASAILALTATGALGLLHLGSAAGLSLLLFFLYGFLGFTLLANFVRDR